jgi:lipid-A-disaccharide synthase
MVVFYRVSGPSWVVGKLLVDVPFYSMVNLMAGRQIVPELIQSDCQAARLVAESQRLLSDGTASRQMRDDLSAVGVALRGKQPAARRAADVICEQWQWTGKLPRTDSLVVS